MTAKTESSTVEPEPDRTLRQRQRPVKAEAGPKKRYRLTSGKFHQRQPDGSKITFRPGDVVEVSETGAKALQDLLAPLDDGETPVAPRDEIGNFGFKLPVGGGIALADASAGIIARSMEHYQEVAAKADDLGDAAAAGEARKVAGWLGRIKIGMREHGRATVAQQMSPADVSTMVHRGLNY